MYMSNVLMWVWMYRGGCVSLDVDVGGCLVQMSLGKAMFGLSIILLYVSLQGLSWLMSTAYKCLTTKS